MEKQPEALRLADYLADRNQLELTCDEAAAELRRLHDENEHLRMSQYGSGRLQMLRNQRDELLEALKNLESVFTEGAAANRDWRNRARLALIASRAAIAKATGQ